MKITVEYQGKPVTIFLTNFDTVYSIKEKIQRCLGFPVARQTLFFNGILLNDHHDVAQCQIVNNSCLGLFVSSDNPNRNNDQMRHQTQQSPAPSNSTQQTIHGIQDWPPVTVQTEQSPVPSISTEDLLGQDFSPPMISNFQDSSVMVVRSNNNQTEQSLEPSNLTEQVLGHDFSMTTEDMINMQSVWPPVISNVQDSPVMVRSNNNQTEQFPPPSNSTGDIIYGQEWPFMVRSNNNQVLQTEQYPMSAPMNINEEVVSRLEPSDEENLYSQATPVVVRSNNNESVLSEIEEFLLNQDSPVVESSRNNESESLSEIEEFLGIQDSHPVTVESSRNKESSPPPSYTLDEIFGDQELPPVTVGSRRNRNQVAQTEKSPLASDSAIEVINITDSPVKKKMKTGPVKLRVRVQPYEETRTIQMEFNAGDKVEELRKEVVKMHEKGELNLPQPFFFIHNQQPLNETQSFYWNNVAHGDLIEIWIGELIRREPVLERVIITRA